MSKGVAARRNYMEKASAKKSDGRKNEQNNKSKIRDEMGAYQTMFTTLPIKSSISSLLSWKR